MIEISGMFGWLSAALLFVAIAAWLKLGRRPRLERVSGRALREGEVENASRLLVIAVASCAVAAVLAMAGWMFG
jgi:hypothetical protein